MTNDPMPNDPMLALPGLEPTPADRPVSSLEVAVRRTLRALDEDGLVHEVDAGKSQLAIELAQVIAGKKSSGKSSTIGNDARVLMEILNDFKEEASEVDGDLARVMDEWREVIARAHPDSSRSPEVRDTA